jgi:hypothetical protein
VKIRLGGPGDDPPQRSAWQDHHIKGQRSDRCRVNEQSAKAPGQSPGHKGQTIVEREMSLISGDGLLRCLLSIYSVVV